MHINWLGQTCVKLQTKNLKDEDIVIIIDPYKPEKGDFPRNFSPDVVLYSKTAKDSVTISDSAFIIETLGEYEVKDNMIYALAANDQEMIFKISAEGMNIVHLGNVKEKISEHIIEKLGTPDILFLPVGNGEKSLDPKKAREAVSILEPRVIIPIAYQCDTDPKALPVESFLKEIGLKPEITEKKIIIKKKDLPQEDTKIFVLEKNY
ncbi:MAG TPA: MBL fold metallo-hydrolase [Candidatus Magasanikbacteria bacterium]|nr:MBL fold metallo-hydrolase [Candidatus Magasanikbacteria bacterium]